MISNKYINIFIAMIMTLSIALAGVMATVDMSRFEANATGKTTHPEYITNLFNKDDIMEIDIDIDEKLWNELADNAMEEEYYSANITINGETYYNVGLRAKGNTTLSQIANDDTTDRYSFKVKFDEYIDGQTLKGLEKLALNNMMQDTTYMKEYLSYDLLDKMGVSTPAFQYASITLNGEPWGLYLALEVMEESYIERYYGTTGGNLYKPETTNMAGGMGGAKVDMEMNNDATTKATTDTNKKNPNFNNEENLMSPPPNPEMNNSPEKGDQVNMANNNMTMEQGKEINGPMGRDTGGADLVYSGDEHSNYSIIFENAIFDYTNEDDYDKIIAMIKSLNEDIDDIEKYLDVDEVLRYFAVNTFVVNLDSYASNMKHNYYLYEQGGICSILPWDYNLAFGAFQGGSASNVINFPIDNPVGDSLESSPLIGKLLEVDEYKEKYHEYLNEIVQDYVNSGVFTETINNIDNLIGDYVKNDATTFYTYDEYVASIPELITYGVDRAKSISAQLSGSQSSTSTGNMATNLNLSALGSQGGGGNRDGKDIPQDMKENNNTEKGMGIGEKPSNMQNNSEKGAPQGNFMPRNNPGGVNRGNSPNNIMRNTSNDANIKSNLIIYVICIVGIIVAIIVVLRFKRKKYHV
ncbi:CotH kinase family protein [Clostridium sp. UBA5119]|uniref:CotH kinase family protein n=1 Tax=Clostridium sp. UBA5119 TaxID=1946366 RepID=UPI0032175C72